jgi:hypothetical protein
LFVLTAAANGFQRKREIGERKRKGRRRLRECDFRLSLMTSSGFHSHVLTRLCTTPSFGCSLPHFPSKMLM